MLNFKNTHLEYFNPYPNVVRGSYYLAEFFNGAIFIFWSGRKLNRKEARQAALIIANGDYWPPPYDKDDIRWVRKQKV